MSGLRLQPPRGPRSPYYVVRGKYLGVDLRNGRSTGTADRKIAAKILQKWKREIESGAYAPPSQPVFADAVTSYGNAGGDERFTLKLLDHFGQTPLADITQAKIDEAAVALYPNASPATRNRQVYTPMSAILRHAKIDLSLTRPKGSRGNARTTWLEPEQAFALLAAAEALEPRFGALCTVLLYCGCRLSEALALHWADVDLPRATAYLRMTKNGEPRTMYLPKVVVAALANLDHEAGSVFRYTKGRWVYRLFDKACAAAGLVIDERVAFHCFRHSFGAWLRRYAEMDTAGLVATGAWKSRQAASIYEHVEAPEEAKKTELFPTPGPGQVRRG